MNNPIIDEIREARAALAEEHGYDLVRINAWAQTQTDLRRKHSTPSAATNELEPTNRTSSAMELSATHTRRPVATRTSGPTLGII